MEYLKITIVMWIFHVWNGDKSSMQCMYYIASIFYVFHITFEIYYLMFANLLHPHK